VALGFPGPEFRVQGLRCRVWGLGFRVPDYKRRVQGQESSVKGWRFRAQASGYRVIVLTV
jgi:hypothetical protein